MRNNYTAQWLSAYLLYNVLVAIQRKKKNDKGVATQIVSVFYVPGYNNI